MANQIPIAGTSNAAGAYLLNPEFAELLVTGLRRESAIAQIARVVTMNTRQRKYPIYAGRPEVGFVDEGTDKPITGAEFQTMTVDIKKLSAIVVYTEEILEDAEADPRMLVSADVQAALAHKIDAHATGYENGVAIVSPQFNDSLAESTNDVELADVTGDSIAIAVSQAMEKVEENGYRPSGIVLSSKFRAAFRDARGSGDNATMPVYTNGFGREPDTLYGLPIAYSSNLAAPVAGEDPVMSGYVLDGSQAILAIRKDVSVRVSTEAVVGTHNLFRQNKVAYLWEARVGFAVHDLNRSVAPITIPADEG